MIAIVDYGIGNLGSVTKGFRHAGAETVLTGSAEELRRADALVLPATAPSPPRWRSCAGAGSSTF